MNHALLSTSMLALLLAACGNSETVSPAPTDKVVSAMPSDHIDLSNWNITVPTDVDNNKKVDTVKVADIPVSYTHLTLPTICSV